MAKKTRVTKASNSAIAPELNPRDTDVKYVGGEPVFYEQPDPAERNSVLVKSFNWYSRFFDRKMGKELTIAFAESQNFTSSEIKLLRSVKEHEFNPSLGWLARLSARGLTLTEQEHSRIVSDIKSILESSSQEEEEETDAEETTVSSRPNVQEIMRERTRTVAGEIEGLFDSYLTTGEPQPADLNIVGLLTEHNIMPQHTSIIVDAWKRRRQELEDVQEGKDADLKEGYSQYGKVSIRNIIKFCDAVLAGVASYLNVKKTSAKPRKRKAVPVGKQVADVKYCRTFKDTPLNIELTSVHPSKIVGATEVWAYDTSKRKLHYYVADSHVGTLSVKGTTILGFDATQSGMKTLRKPQEQLKKLIAAGKPAARKLFKEINAVQASVKGRTNENLVILKTY